MISSEYQGGVARQMSWEEKKAPKIPDPVKASPISMAFDELSKALELAHEEFNYLEDKLMPAILLQPEKPTGGPEVPPPPRSKLEAQLVDAYSSANRLRQKIVELRKGVQL